MYKFEEINYNQILGLTDEKNLNYLLYCGFQENTYDFQYFNHMQESGKFLYCSNQEEFNNIYQDFKLRYPSYDQPLRRCLDDYMATSDITYVFEMSLTDKVKCLILLLKGFYPDLGVGKYFG